jgi:hypothetical protein
VGARRAAEHTHSTALSTHSKALSFYTVFSMHSLFTHSKAFWHNVQCTVAYRAYTELQATVGRGYPAIPGIRETAAPFTPTAAAAPSPPIHPTPPPFTPHSRQPLLHGGLVVRLRQHCLRLELAGEVEAVPVRAEVRPVRGRVREAAAARVAALHLDIALHPPRS